MSSELQSVVSSIVENNYVTRARIDAYLLSSDLTSLPVVILTAIGYDYILALSDEIEYIWNGSWGWVSILFVLVRYVGLCGVISVYQDLYHRGEFLSTWACNGVCVHPLLVTDSYHRLILLNSCEILGILGEWAMLVFMGAADLVMILRVWAMYSGSKIVLGVLLPLYVLEMVSFTINSIVVSIKSTAVADQVLNFSFCLVEFEASPIWADVRNSLQFVLAAVMWLLVIAKFIRNSYQMYKMTKEWRISRYLNLFAREGMLYFLAVLLFGIFNILIFAGKIPLTGWQLIPIGFFNYVPVFTLVPRFIVSVRALHARELRCEPHYATTVPGSRSVPGSGGRGTSSGTSIMFAGLREEDGFAQDEEIHMEERGKRRAGSGF
ncbi:hypothetical protein OG21DRAFT_1481290 [Imleria badia]|nr:hypothetical protein OG21DRAFT_1481290 [Imleria badia]